MNRDSKIYIAGHKGMVGSAILRNLQNLGYTNFVLRTSGELDLTNQAEVNSFFEKECPEYVFDAAAKVGGIVANNTYKAQFIYENLMIQNNIIHSSYKYGVKKLLFLGSSCIYPKNAPQPLKEEYLLEGKLEETNESYAIAKIAGIKMCESYFQQYACNFISIMPTNLYGLNDNYNLETSHVLPAIIRKMHLAKCLENNNWDAVRNDLRKRPIEGITHEAKKEDIISLLKKYGIVYSENEPSKTKIVLWGSGNVYREFLFVDDLADASIHIMTNIDAKQLYTEIGHSHINIGTQSDLTIKDLTWLIKGIIGYIGDIEWDTTKPDGTYKKQLDVNVATSLGWRYKTKLQLGINSVYSNYINE